MRMIVVVLCLAAAACSGQSLTSPASPLGNGGLSGSSAKAGTDLPFTGSFTGISRGVFVPPTTLRLTATHSGTATLLGRFTTATVDNVNVTNNTATGTWTFTAANGDQLFATTAGAETQFVPPNISKVVIEGTIVSGTGRFAGATGSFTVDLVQEIDEAAATAVVSGSFEGHLSLNN